MCKDFKDAKKKYDDNRDEKREKRLEEIEKRLEEMCKDFEDAKKKYNDFRNKERLAIVDALNASGFDDTKWYQGTWGYTSRRKINPPHDLGMWKWIVASKGDITVFIKLQTLEQDETTKNIHVLLDRISIDAFQDPNKDILSEENDSYSKSIKERYGVENQFDSKFVNATITKFSLPLKEEELEELVECVEEKVDALKKKVEELN